MNYNAVIKSFKRQTKKSNKQLSYSLRQTNKQSIKTLKQNLEKITL